MRNMETTERRMPLPLFVERVLAAMTLLGFACLIIGLPLFIIGRTSNNFTLSQVGAYILLVGIALLAMRIFYWILEEIVGRGQDTMARTQLTARAVWIGIEFLFIEIHKERLVLVG